MSKRGDYIHKRKDGRWEGRYQNGRNIDGTLKYKSIYGKSYHEVKERLKNILKDNEHTIKTKKITFGEVLNLWIDNNKIRLKGGTINKYKNIIESHIMPELGNILIKEMNTTIINKFLYNKISFGRIKNNGKLSASYVRSMMIIINSALKFAVANNYCLPLNTQIYKPVCTKKGITILDQAMQKELEALLLKKLNLTNLGIYISLQTGLRIGEICALKWDDIDMNNKVIHVRHTIARIRNDIDTSKVTTKLIIDSPKTKASKRDIPITNKLYLVINQVKSLSSKGFVLTDTDTFVSPRTFEYRFHKTLSEFELPKINYHVLRHTFATRCIEAGVDIKSLSEILGHGNVSITLNTYVHSSMDMKRNQLEKLSNLLY